MAFISIHITDDGAAEMGPLVERPDGPGPMSVGQIDITVRFSTKAYDTHLRIFYPATDEGTGTPPDISGAPYMTVVWFPFFGGDHLAVDPQSLQLASWGAVVVAFGVNWQDLGGSGDTDDMNDLLDLLEELNDTASHSLFGMVDKEAYGVCGYSSGGGISLITGAQVPRIKAIQSWAAAIFNAAVDGIAPMFDGRPLLLQVGKDDTAYIQGSRRAYQKVGEPCILVEILGAGHGGPFIDHMYIAFFLFHLKGEDDYGTFLYGDKAVDLAADAKADIYFKLNEDHFFPPAVTTVVSPLEVLMDEPVSLEANIHGYQRQNGSDLVHGWDIDGDGRIDLKVTGGPNTTHAFIFPGDLNVQYHYQIRLFSVLGEVHTVRVANVAPLAVAGPDVVVDHDGVAQLDGGASWDSPSDAAWLMYRWEFSDGYTTDSTRSSIVSRQFPEVGAMTATLTVRDPHGAEVTDTLNVTVVNVPPALTTVDRLTVVEDDHIVLEGIGNDTPSHTGHLVYRWDFGDGMGSDWRVTSQTNHSYPRSGNYTVTLSVKDPEGAVASASTNVTVLNIAPEGVIDRPVNGSEHDKESLVEFNASGTDTPSDQVDLLFMWDFGDGTSTDWLGRRDTQMSHAYNEGGVFVVTLTITDTDDAVHIITSTIAIINTPPEAQLKWPLPSVTVDEDTTVRFEGSGTDTPGDQSGLEYKWVIDGQTYPGAFVEHEFHEVGKYEAVFSVTDPDGGIGSIKVEVTVVNVVPEVTLGLDRTSIETGESVNYSVDIIDTPSDDGLHMITWDFGDGNMSNDAIGTHVFSFNGTFTVRVTVEDDDGDTATATMSLTVTDPPEKPVVPPIDDGPGDSDNGVNMLFYGGLAAVVLIAGALIVVLVIKRKGLA
jgi:dienelactone hydrolase